MTLHLAVVGHVSRLEQAEALAARFDAELFIDHLTLGSTWNHLRALNWGATKAGHLMVLEDDAEPVDGFLNLAGEWIDSHPDDLTSFYLGTGYPPQYQPKIAAKLTEATDHITLPTLIHAVAYALPCSSIPGLPLTVSRPADYGLGQAWTRHTRRQVLYTVPSLVDHADTPSIENAGRRHTPRKAWRLHEGVASVYGRR